MAQFGSPHQSAQAGSRRLNSGPTGHGRSHSRCGVTASPRSGSTIRPSGRNRFDDGRASHARDSAWRPLKVRRLGSVTPAR
jgi:hypothetical protein